MSTWLVHSTQVFDQILFWMFVWKCFLDEINIYIHGLWVKEIILHSVGGPCPISWRLTEQRLTSSKQEGILPQTSSGHKLQLFPQPNCLFPTPSDFVLSKHPQSHEPIPYNQSLSLYIYLYTHTHNTHTDTLWVLFLSKTLIHWLSHFTELLFR